MRTIALTALLAVATAGALVMAFGGQLPVEEGAWALGWLPWAPAGYLILLKRPGNGVGRALFATGLGFGTSSLLAVLAVRLPAGGWAAWVELGSHLAFVIPWPALIWTLLVFPTGAYAGRAERVIGYCTIGFMLVALLTFAVNSAPMERTGLPSPLAVQALAGFSAAVTSPTGFLGVVALVLAATGSLVVRWRRSAGVERHQFRWLMFGAMFFAVALTLSQFLPQFAYREWFWLAIIAPSAIPISVGVAVLRYRLYEIDRIISRTTTYTLLVAALGAVFLGTVAVVQRLLPAQGELGVVASTLLVAALFNPLHRRVQTTVDRRFNRSRYDARRVLEQFSARLRDEVDLELLQASLLSITQEAVQPTQLSLWVRE